MNEDPQFVAARGGQCRIQEIATKTRLLLQNALCKIESEEHEIA